MAVDDFLSHDTESFVLPSKSYYPLKIPIAHYQLRHFISSPEQDLLYYASGCDVYCLNTATKTRAHVTTLPWEARCTASGHGYVCVGGAEDGNFAAIKVAGFPPADPAEVDSLLPIDLGSRTSVPRPPVLGAALRIHLERIGEDIVNSVSIHKLPAKRDGEAGDVVAVLTNNDKTVRIYSLPYDLEIAVVDLSFPMNHASISPDGQLMVAVGDQPHAFFFERAKTSEPNFMLPSEIIQSDPPGWTLIDEVRLHVPSGSPNEGYFTTAWSPSGQLCALGSECGYITIFDTQLLKLCEYGEDAIVQMITSSRPDAMAGPGAVRTLQFSPAPWDFLIWSEDQARVCVADMRSGLKVKQILELDPKDETLEKVEVAEFDLTLSPEMQDLRREADFIRRYRRALDSEGTAAAVNFATDYIEASSERRRRHRQLGVVESDNDPHGLTAHERQILEALRTPRQRDEVGEPRATPRSIHYENARSNETRRHRISPDMFPSLRNDGRSREREPTTRRNMVERLNELMSESTRQLSQLEDDLAPLRRASVVLSNDGANGNTEATGNITDAATTRSPNPIPAYARRVDAEVMSSTENAWRTIEAALARNVRAADNIRNAAAPELRTELRHLRQLTQMRERLRNAREGQPLDAYSLGGLSTRYRRVSRSGNHDPADGVRNAGLAISKDGHRLYCGTEEGVFEFHINLHERRGFPAITPR